MYAHDTIAAIATPPGQGGVAIIRVSGPEAEGVARRMFRLHNPTAQVRSHTLYFGRVIDPHSEHTLDEGLLTLMHAPHSYTGEETAEIHCHGGGFLAHRILSVVLQQGARLAQPGEFTQRAFLNGRLDLSQAEAVLDLIQAKSDQGVHLAMEQLSGRLSEAYAAVRERLLHLTAYVEAFLDFPEDDIPERAQTELEQDAIALIERLTALASTFTQGKVYREGVRTVIVGKPNVGKSSLLNLLLDEERAIVTAIPGTTRDMIEETVVVGGIPLVLCDTAGLRQTTDEVEQLGVHRTRAGIDTAELILAVFDGSRYIDEEDQSVLAILSGKNVILLLNKTDLPPLFDETCVVTHFPAQSLVKISAVTGEGKALLEKRIHDIIFGHAADGAPQQSAIVSHLRHRDALLKTKQFLDNALAGLRSGLPLDLVAVDLHAALAHIGEITGHITSEDILDRIFREFCIGK
ncbi:MAG: tRNA uridine-5-carboxymethylaminomethyl(34) synthesis GTPase MnmE [Deltaproteobacteria bacterium]|nr:tRNA uridine-5-carboxymethylaminomethyl(34) synthesis GTPase MnmE [Deltaproteobacteria bacterium]